MGEIEWENINVNHQGGDWVGEAIVLSGDGDALVTEDNTSFSFSINQFILKRFERV
jgi:hypothetical protein